MSEDMPDIAVEGAEGPPLLPKGTESRESSPRLRTFGSNVF